MENKTNLGKVEIAIDSFNIKYYLTVDRKFTLICGNSGSGKSFLCDIIHEVNIGNDTRTKIGCKSSLDIKNIQLFTLNSDETSAVISAKNKTNTIFLVDEDYTKILTKEFREEILKSSNYFIIFKREPSLGYQISSEAIYELKRISQDGNDINTIFKKYPYSSVNINVSDKNNLLIYTEDGGTGKSFWEKLANVKASSGVGGVKKIIIEDNSNLDKLLVIDSEGAGNVIERLTEFCVRKNIKIYAPPCYEYIAMKGYNCLNFDNKKFNNMELSDVDYSKPKIISWERWCKYIYKSSAIKIKNIINLLTSSPENIKKVLTEIKCFIKCYI